MKKHGFVRFLVSLMLFAGLFPALAVHPAQAATTLTAGDIAIVGFNFDDSDDFAFVLLVDVTSGTEIKVTDNGWTAAGAFRPGEGVYTWTAGSNYTAGTVRSLGANGGEFAMSGSFAFSASGDQVLAYQGADSSPTFLYALNSEGTGWQSDATSSNTSALPTGLVNGASAVALNEIDNAVYSGTTSGTQTELLAVIGNSANWSGSDTLRQTMPAGPFTVNGSPVDNPPAVSSTTPANSATGIVISSNLTVNFSEAVTVSGNWAQVVCASATQSVGGGTLVVSGGPQNYTLDPAANFAYSESCSATVFAAQVADQDGAAHNMTADAVWSFTTQSNPGAPTPIYDVQGVGSASPLVGQTVTVEGIVVGDFQDTVSGFFLQEMNADADPLTSEGIFVYTTSPVAAGDRVIVTGVVSEYFNETEITPSSVIVVSAGNPLPAAANIVLPVADAANWERYEGMHVAFTQTLKVTEVYLLGRGGLITLADELIYQPTHVALPGAPALAVAAENLKHTIILDDGSQAQNPDPVRWPTPGGLSAGNTVRVGYNVSGVSGVLTQRYHGWSGSLNTYRIYPTADATFDASGNPRTAAPESVGGALQVASFNVLNYFNGDGLGGGFPTSRGASSALEFTRQRDKIISAILALDADVIGLMEIENDGYAAASAIQDLVNGLNAIAGAGTYAFINPNAPATGVFGGDEITVGMIYRPAVVTPVGAAATTTAGAFTQDADRRNRQPLAQAFQFPASGETFIVVVNHFKSKGSDCATANATFPADPDTGDGQGNCNLTRTMAAEDLLDWLATDPTGAGDPDILIIGDLNAYAQEDPITVIKNGGYTDLINVYQGAAGYSYVFDGQLGYLDHALASASLAAKVTGAGDWHINGIEPLSLDYNLENKTIGQQSSFYSSDAYRASDHDPALIGLIGYDVGDLPGSYGNALHYSPQNRYLGAAARSDDGVSILSSGNWQPNSPVTVRANITGGSGWLTCWFDWDLSGAFEGDEKTINQAVSGGNNDINFNVPADAAVGIGAAVELPVRCRLYESAGEPAALLEGSNGVTEAAPAGAVVGGEVEDHLWGFGPTALTLTDFRAPLENPVGWRGILLAVGAVALVGVALQRRRG